MTVRKKESREIADILIAISNKRFMGKRTGGYQLSKALFREIVGGRRNVNLNKITREVNNLLNKRKYLVVNLGNVVIILQAKEIKDLRTAPRAVLKEYICVVDNDDVGRVTEADLDEVEGFMWRHIPQ